MIIGFSSLAESSSVSAFCPDSSPPETATANGLHNPQRKENRMPADRRFSTDHRPPTADEETSPFLIGSLKFRRRVFNNQRPNGNGNEDLSEVCRPQKFEMSAPPNRKFDLCSPMLVPSSDLSPQVPPRQLILPAPVIEPISPEGGATSRGPSRNPSPNKRTSSGNEAQTRITFFSEGSKCCVQLFSIDQA